MEIEGRPRVVLRNYPHWFYLPAGIVYVLFFLVPTALAFYFSLTRWTLFDAVFIGIQNYRDFLGDPQLISGLRNTILYAVMTSGLKVIIGLLLATLLTSQLRLQGLFRALIFFPVLVSTVAVGITFSTLMQPSTGLINNALAVFGIQGPDWLGNPRLALFSVALVDVWKGVGLATVIFIAGIVSIPVEYFEAARLEGGAWVKFRHIIIPLARNATFTVILLSFIGGLRSFDLIWTMTKGGPGFASDVLTSVIYKEYQAGFYGLSTAGNVVLFILLMIIIYPLMRFFNRREIRAMRHESSGRSSPSSHVRKFIARVWMDVLTLIVVGIVFVVPFIFILLTASKTRQEASLFEFSLPSNFQLIENIRTVLTFGNGRMLLALWNSTILTVGSITLIVVFAALVAFVLQRRNDRVANIVSSALLAGLIIPPRSCRQSSCCSGWASTRRCSASSWSKWQLLCPLPR